MINKINKSTLNHEIIYGMHPVLESIKAGKRKFFEIYISKEKKPSRLIEIEQFANDNNIPIRKLKNSELSEITDIETHQGIAAKVVKYSYKHLDDIFEKNVSDSEEPFLLLLVNIVDPHNLGAIIRTALCTGTHGIVILKNRSAKPTPAVSKASAGALEHVDIASVTNMVNTIQKLKENGIWIVGLDAFAETTLYESQLKGPVAIVVGGEDKGIRPLIKKHCDYLISIPQKGPVNSLNVSVAGAVVMYEALRQRSMTL